MQHTTSVQVTIVHRPNKGPHARAVMWGIDSAGNFGSMWSAEMPLDAGREATTRELMVQMAWALLARLDGELDATA